MPKQFRKKPVVVEAVRLTWSNWSEVCDLVPRPYSDKGVYLDAQGHELPEGQTSEVMGLRINTLESTELTGSLLASQGDWIIKGVNGEFYPCKNDIFEKTYEPMEGLIRCHLCGMVMQPGTFDHLGVCQGRKAGR